MMINLHSSPLELRGSVFASVIESSMSMLMSSPPPPPSPSHPCSSLSLSSVSPASSMSPSIESLPVPKNSLYYKSSSFLWLILAVMHSLNKHTFLSNFGLLEIDCMFLVILKECPWCMLDGIQWPTSLCAHRYWIRHYIPTVPLPMQRFLMQG